MKGSFIRKAVPPATMGLDGLPVQERGAEKRKRVAKRCEVDQLVRCCGATNPCFGKCDDIEFVVVGEVVECGNMFRGEHGAGIEGADEEVCGVSGTWIGLDIPTEQCGGE